MEDPTFSEIISFIWLSDSQFIWLPVKFLFILCTNNHFLPRRKATKSSSWEKEKYKQTLTPQLQHKSDEIQTGATQ